MDRHLDDLTKLFLKFPGIGERQARRFAHFIISEPKQYVDRLSDALRAARTNAHVCARCFKVFEGDDTLCSTCSDPTRDNSLLLVVEKSQDIESFRGTEYQGQFFVLGGLIPIVQKKILDEIRLHELKKRLSEDKDIQEVILAFPVTPNGEHTDHVLREQLASFPQELNSLGRGLSIGTELEYADPLSLNASLKKRE